MDGVNGAVVGETSAVRRLQQVRLIPLELNPCFRRGILLEVCVQSFLQHRKDLQWLIGLLQLRSNLRITLHTTVVAKLHRRVKDEKRARARRWSTFKTIFLRLLNRLVLGCKRMGALHAPSFLCCPKASRSVLPTTLF